MVKKRRKVYRNGPFGSLNEAAVGTAKLGIIAGVGAGIAARAPAGTPSLTAGFSTIAGFVPIATTAVAGKAVLGSVKKLEKKKKKYF